MILQRECEKCGETEGLEHYECQYGCQHTFCKACVEADKKRRTTWVDINDVERVI